jgi:hypothetical protein
MLTPPEVHASPPATSPKAARLLLSYQREYFQDDIRHANGNLL